MLKEIIKKMLLVFAFLGVILCNNIYAFTSEELNAANELSSKGIINNYSCDVEKYNLDGSLLRQEVAAIAMQITSQKTVGNTFCKGYFKDVFSVKPNNWSCFSIEPLVDLGVIEKTDYFRPESNITKIEALTLMIKAGLYWENIYDSEKSSSQETQILEFAVENGIVKNFNDLNTPATRGFIFNVVSKILDYNEQNNYEDEIVYNNETNVENENIANDGYENDESSKQLLCEILGVCEVNNSETNDEYEYWVTPGMGDSNSSITTNELFVSINVSSPGNQTIPSSGVVLFGKIDFNARGQDVIIDSITLRREGLGSRVDIQRVFFEKNGIRVTTRGTVAYDDTVELFFSPVLTINKGSTTTLDLMVELSGKTSYGNENRFSIRSEEDVKTNSKVSGYFPVRTGLMGAGVYNTGKIDITPINISANHTSGQRNALMSEFRLSYNGENTLEFKGLKMRNMGDANAETSLDNIKLYRDGNEVSYQVSVNGKDISISLYNTIKANENAVYQLRADIIKWDKNGEKYQIEIRNSSDVNIIEENTGFSPSINITN